MSNPLNVRIYARASTDDQDATRALPVLHAFAADRGWLVAGEYVENASGASLKRSGLQALLADAQPGDVLLVEAVDRLSRLEESEWLELRLLIQTKGVMLAVVNLPTSWAMLGTSSDALTSGVMRAVNDLMVELMATMARQDYETRRQRQAQGIEKAKANGKYTGKPKDTQARAQVAELLAQGMKPAHILKIAGISQATFYRIKAELSAAGETGQ